MNGWPLFASLILLALPTPSLAHHRKVKPARPGAHTDQHRMETLTFALMRLDLAYYLSGDRRYVQVCGEDARSGERNRSA